MKPGDPSPRGRVCARGCNKRNRRLDPKRRRGEGKRTFVGRLKRISSVVLATVALVGAATAIYNGWHALRSSGRFRVRTLELRGHARLHRGEVRPYAGLHVGMGIFDVDVDTAAEGLLRHPWVRATSVRRRLPDTIQVEVTEHEPHMLVSLGDTYLANAEGVLFKRLAATDAVTLPVLTGLEREEFLGDVGAGASRVRIAIALRERIEEREPALGRLEEIHWDTDLGWSVVLRPGAAAGSSVVQLGLGLSPLERVSLGGKVLRHLRALGKRPESIDLASQKRPRRVYARVKGGGGDREPETVIARAR